MEKLITIIFSVYIFIGAVHGLLAPANGAFSPAGWMIDTLAWPLRYIFLM